MLPLWALPSPMLTECEVLAMILSEILIECRNSVAICRGTREAYKYFVIRDEEGGAIWLVVAQVLSNHFPLMRVDD